MKTYKGFERENGEIVDHAYIDGYWFGDRLLEGVFFKISVVNGELVAEVKKEDAGYFENLNKEKWLKEAVKFSSGNDIFYGSGDYEEEELILIEA